MDVSKCIIWKKISLFTNFELNSCLDENPFCLRDFFYNSNQLSVDVIFFWPIESSEWIFVIA